jgi:Bacterial antitoxin of type II TA system, VapB
VKTTIDIPEKSLREVMRNTGAATKREAVVTAIDEYNRRRRLEQLVKKFGTFTDFMTQEDLARSRNDQ